MDKYLTRRKEMNRFMVFGVLMALASVGSAAVSLGSTSDVTALDLNPGEYGIFQASFFNMGSDPLEVEFELEYPSDLKVELTPDYLYLGTDLSSQPTSSGEWLILDGGRRYVKTYPVRLYVKIPSDISRNKYPIKLIARAQSSSDPSGDGIEQSLVQVREILFSADVDGRIRNNDVSTIRIDASSGDKIAEEAQKSIKEKSSSSSASTGSNAPDYSNQWPSAQASSGAPEENEEVTVKKDSFINKGSGGGTDINLPTGKVSISEEQTNTAIDLGLVTLLVSIASLAVRIIK